MENNPWEINVNYYGTIKNIKGRNKVRKFVRAHGRIFNSPEDKAARQEARDKRISKHITIDRKEVTVNGKKDISDYKGQEIYEFSNLVKYFTTSAKNIESHIAEGDYSISSAKITIDSVDVKTASNEYDPRDTIPADGRKPDEKDTVSTSDSADRFAWYNINATINGVKIQTGWLCRGDYGNADGAARDAADDVSRNVGDYADDVARALEQVYQAYLAKQKQQPQNGKSKDGK